MSKAEKKILLFLGGLIAILSVYVAVRLWASDAVLSIAGWHTVAPGWHTVIYPAEITLAILTILILVGSMTVYLVFRGTNKLFSVLWTRRKSSLR